MPTTPTKEGANGAKPKLTQREMEIISKAWLCITEIKDGVPQVDSKKLAEVGGYRTGDSARHIWKPIRIKLMALSGIEPTSVSPKTKAKNAAQKRKAGGVDENGDMEPPARRFRARKKMTFKEESDDELSELNDEDFKERCGCLRTSSGTS